MRQAAGLFSPHAIGYSAFKRTGNWRRVTMDQTALVVIDVQKAMFLEEDHAGTR
jgi:hypothetical protein